MKLLPDVKPDAGLSPDGTYRYWLSRTWSEKPDVAWIMLNPSTADAAVDDATIRRCQGFARSWGYGGIIVVSLFALRATSPKALQAHPDPVGPANDDVLRRVFETTASGIIVAAWGTHGKLRNRDAVAVGIAGQQERSLHCLALTKHGKPQHPLYVPGDTQPMIYRVAL